MNRYEQTPTRPLAILTLAIAAAVGIGATPLAAQAAPKKAAKKAPAKKKAAAPVAPPLADADDAQKAAYERVYLGTYDCEFGQTMTVEPNPKKEAWTLVKFQKYAFDMKPVLSSTGAIRLEGAKNDSLVVQIANKSMLMDTRRGVRLVDECRTGTQKTAEEAAKAAAAAGSAPASLFAPAAAPASAAASSAASAASGAQ